MVVSGQGDQLADGGRRIRVTVGMALGHDVSLVLEGLWCILKFTGLDIGYLGSFWHS